ncbi:gamma-interferon-inducible lysosomal thiol reductase-like isoform X3 [Palaemon carinicauda]|uniref:gamma-interferon-inducible lysosomal thiol reductase-like isoform X3 n=1 Tax=Palaemon carinicauda TaxID=392227 RepID=UPI0035B57AB8
MGGGRLIRFMILVLVVVLVWKVWDYSALPVVETPNFKTNVRDSQTETTPAKANQMQNDGLLNILPPPDKPEDIEVEVNPPMNVAVYYEALCPDSRHFVMKQLTPAFKKLNDIIDLHLVPYGKASTMEKNGKFTFECQHGPLECQANMVHACVTNIFKDQTKQLSIVHCMIDKNMQPLVAGQKCVENHKEKWADVENCINSDHGANILKHMGDMTHSLKPKASFIPTITIDGSQDEQKHILQDFHKVLCQKFKGPKHPSC